VAVTAGLEISRRMVSDRSSEAAFAGASALLFAGSATLTIAWCTSMSAMGGMPMPGGWTMSMAWMRMPGQTWPGAAASFLGMWVVMMVAMMLPSLVPMLLLLTAITRVVDHDRNEIRGGRWTSKVKRRRTSSETCGYPTYCQPPPSARYS
jgi:predicted metal-binding membrane protein